MRGKYACLSHRWIEGDTPTTTESNILERTASIEFMSLPLRYQEAISFARSIGISYLWVDSLCIMQDSGSPDWLKEAPRMAEYYGNAYLTISASMATENGQGCYSKTSSGTQGLQFTWRDGTSYAVRFRIPLSHKESPLHARGWIFQEYMLSRRVVHFLEDEVIWECGEATWCECGRVNDMRGGSFLLGPISDSLHQSNAYRLKRRFQSSVETGNCALRLANTWREIIHEYTKRKLTFQTDVFPALAGLVKKMQALRGSKYYAGLWEDDLVGDLLWEAEDEEWYPVGHTYPPPDKWRAPSWSWASSTAIINWTHSPVDSATGRFEDIDLLSEIFIRDLEVECHHLTEDKTMSVESGTLRLTGDLAVAPLRLDKIRGYADSNGGGVSLDCLIPAEDIVDPSTLRSLLVAKLGLAGSEYLSLILKPVGTELHHYRRIGRLSHPTLLQPTDTSARITII